MSVCVRCNSWKTKVLQTRKLRNDGWTFRERRCDLCGHRWDTVEVPAEDVRVPSTTQQDDTDGHSDD